MRQGATYGQARAQLAEMSEDSTQVETDDPQPFRPDEQTVTVAIQSLVDAADDDSATGGPDMLRRIFPVIGVVTADGYRRLPAELTDYKE